VTTVGLLGEGVAMEAVRAALADTDAGAVAVDPAGVGGCDVAVAVGPSGGEDAGEGLLERTGAQARKTHTPLVAVELGGVGGRPVEGVSASASGHAPGTACRACLRERVAAADPATDDGDCEAAAARFAGAVAGRELATLVGGGESALVGGVIEVPHARRRVLPVPYCECGAGDAEGGAGVEAGSGDGDAGVPRHHEARSLEESISMAEVAFDERVGPISAIGEAESFPVPYYLATLAATPFSDADAPDHAAGVGIDWDPAFMKALGEALERYSAAVYRERAFETDPAAPIRPDRFVAPEGTDPEVTRWCGGEHLPTGDRVQLPAELVVFPPPERTIRPAITTGLGLGNGGVGALLSGLYEVLERDATMLSWYSTYEPMGLAVDDEGYRTLENRAKSEGLETTALVCTQDVDVPVVAACVHREGEWPRFAAGSAADLDPEAAARDALAEALQNWLELRRMGETRADEEHGAIGTHAAFPESTRAFVDPATTVPAAEIGPSEPPTGAAELDALVGRVDDAGLDTYASRITPRDVESMGFEAVRVLIPSAQPLFTGDPYFGERSRRVPESLGFEPDLDREYHPFP
jgi:ribosomal protein S12 methylthiotransferase accessory factor